MRDKLNNNKFDTDEKMYTIIVYVYPWHASI